MISTPTIGIRPASSHWTSPLERHVIDSLDLQLMQALQLDGRAPFSRIAEVLGVSDQTVARRFRRLHASTGLRILGITDEARFGRTSWIVRLQCTPDGAEQLGNALARRADTSYVGLLSGGTEVICAMRPRSSQERDELLLDRLQRTPRVTSVSAHCVLRHFYGGPLGWLNKINALDADQEDALRLPPADLSSPLPELDDLDETLLSLLHRDGRAPLTELQAATGQSESVVKRRLTRLQTSGVLYFDVQHTHELLGNDVLAALWLTVAPSSLASVGRALSGHPEVRFAAATTGRAGVFAATLHRGTEELYTYLSERIGALDGIQSVEPALIVRQVKQLAYEPPHR
ncbi:Lrp/AsnC family transcriptional regulator [Streptomyces longispororuber]|uniref:Lrp/AsnC family transcriptional regulator n=1 Tax=Streptomyces longispororuber TaxID=68230 RepID=UPI00210A0988|nr:Lrp/AsnC family transcriptional regulator [Streptomyces longispororuber]MCQ4206421.1 Lrp/AsnC family transcriptional regulator [Streptomyces longispororuber]